MRRKRLFVGSTERKRLDQVAAPVMASPEYKVDRGRTTRCDSDKTTFAVLELEMLVTVVRRLRSFWIRSTLTSSVVRFAGMSANAYFRCNCLMVHGGFWNSPMKSRLVGDSCPVTANTGQSAWLLEKLGRAELRCLRTLGCLILRLLRCYLLAVPVDITQIESSCSGRMTP